MNRQYIGARYVPKFYNGTNGTQWEEGVPYEPLTVVTWLTSSYTSKKPVPQGVGAPNLNPDYWAWTGNYEASSGELTERVNTIQNETIPALDTRVTNNENQISENQSDIENLEGRVVIVENNVNGFNNRITTVESGLSTAQDNITELDNRVGTAESNISTVSNRVSSVEGQVINLNSRMTTTENNVSSLDGRVTTVEDNVSAISGDATKGKDAYDAIDALKDAEHTTVENVMAFIKNNADNGNAVYDNVMTHVTEDEHTLPQIVNKLFNNANQGADASEELSTSSGTYANLHTRLTAMQEDIDSAKSDIDNFASCDIRNYGGIADGATDNANAIRNCLAENGYCLMPNYNGQSYVVNSTINLTAGQTIAGTEGTKIIGNASPLFNIKGLNVAIRNLNINIVGTVAFHLNNNVTDVSYVNIDNVYTTSADRFIDDDAMGSHLITNLYINRCAAMYNRKEGVLLRKAYAFIFMNDFTVTFLQTTPNYPAFHIIDCQGAQLTRCEAEGGFINGTHTQNAGFYFERCVAIWLDRCMSDTLDNAGFYFSGCSYIYIDNCVSSLCGSHGFAFVGSGANNNQMRGCYIVGRKTASPSLVGAHGVYMLAGYSKVMECTMSDFSGYGYTSDGAMNNVSDCSFANCLASVYVTGGSGIIHDNMVNIAGDTMSVTGAVKYNNYINGTLVP